MKKYLGVLLLIMSCSVLGKSNALENQGQSSQSNQVIGTDNLVQESTSKETNFVLNSEYLYKSIIEQISKRLKVRENALSLNKIIFSYEEFEQELLNLKYPWDSLFKQGFFDFFIQSLSKKGIHYSSLDALNAVDKNLPELIQALCKHGINLDELVTS